MLTCNMLCFPEFRFQVNDCCCNNTEKCTKTEDDEVTDTQTQWWFPPEIRIHTSKLLVGWGEHPHINSIRHGFKIIFIKAG